MVAHPSPPEPGKAPRYPWDEWLDGREWTLVRGRDYWGESYEMVKRIRRAASRRELHAELDWSLPGLIAVRAESRQGVA